MSLIDKYDSLVDSYKDLERQFEEEKNELDHKEVKDLERQLEEAKNAISILWYNLDQLKEQG